MPKPLSVYYKVASVSYFFIIYKACAVSSFEVLLKMNIEPHGGRGGRHQCSDFFIFSFFTKLSFSCRQQSDPISELASKMGGQRIHL